MNGGGVVFVFESSRQKDLKKKKSKSYLIIIRKAFSHLVKGNKFIPT